MTVLMMVLVMLIGNTHWDLLCSKHFAPISHASKVMLQILQDRPQQYMNHELTDIQAGFRKGRGTQRSNCQHLMDHQKRERAPIKTSTFALLTTPKPLTMWITTNCGKFWKRWKYQNTWPASCENCMQVKKQQLELDMEQQTGSKSGKEYVEAVYCHPAYLTYMQSTSWEMLDWMKHSWNKDYWEKYQ